MNLQRLFRIALGLALACSLLPVQSSAAQAESTPPAPTYVPGEVLVAFPDGRSAKAYAAGAQALAADSGAELVAQAGSVALLSVDPAADVPALAAALEAGGQVLYAQPNWVYSIPEAAAVIERQPGDVNVPAGAAYTVRGANGGRREFSTRQLAAMRSVRSGKSIPAFPKEITGNFYQSWGWDYVESDVIWRNSASSPAVCVVDTGVDGKHPDLKSRVVNGYDFINDDSLPYDDNGHGTHVAGIITARNDNTKGTALGVSNGKVVAVKALNAQGRGTSFSVAAAVRYCAGRSDVRVINLSLGSLAADRLEYDSLRYAIVEKGKLVVAAAGNGGTSLGDYPALWADANVTAPGGGANEIVTGLVAVAAARSNPPYEQVWIDLDGGGDQDEGEFFEASDCATRFTNYGRHVELVAPGDQIYSTQPVSNAFFNNYMYGYAKGYEYDSGTSMAAPYAAAAAARTLSVFKTLTAAQLKQRLINTGRDLTFARDPSGAINAQAAYSTPGYGVNVGGVVHAPFCWPNASFGAANSMERARYLDVSAAMGRVGFYVEVYNAIDGLPLNGARVTITRDASAKSLDTSAVTSTSAGTFLQNIPLPSGATPSATFYLWVSKSGYTAGYQFFDGVVLENPDASANPDVINGGMLATTYNSVAVPPAKNVWAVLNWSMFSPRDLDLLAWLPAGSPADGVVHPGWVTEVLGAGNYRGTDWERGTLLKPSQFGGTVSPYAQIMVEGGGSTSDSPLRFDALQIKDATAKGTQPYYSPSGNSQPYDLYVVDGALENGLEGLSTQPDVDEFADPVVRVWYGGRIVGNNLVINAAGASTCVQAGNDWWHVASLNGATVTAGNQCVSDAGLPR